MTYEKHILLSDYLRSEDGELFGAYGDSNGFSPSVTAIHFLKQYRAVLRAQEVLRLREAASKLINRADELEEINSEIHISGISVHVREVME